MSPDKKQREMLGANASASAETEIIKSVTRSEDTLRDELLCGIPNEVTLNDIATRLPWRDCQVVATVSRGWQRATQNRMVYDARVRSQSTETFFIILSWISTTFRQESCDLSPYNKSLLLEKSTLSLFSPREERWYKLPLVPDCQLRVPSYHQYVILDGSMYGLGGTRRGSAEVHVLDLAAGHPLKWRRCANMQVPRCGFAVGVMHGKIYVFGGESEGTYSEVQNEMYNPKLDAWSWIAPIMPLVYVANVFSVGQEHFVCCGWMLSSPPPGTLTLPEPVSDGKADIRGDPKLVIKIVAGVPRLIRTTDDDAEDEMDGLHQIIQNQLVDGEKGVARSPAKELASIIKFLKQLESDLTPLIRAYDPVKDEWRAFEMESLGTDNAEQVGYTHFLKLAGDLDAAGRAKVWAVSL